MAAVLAIQIASLVPGVLRAGAPGAPGVARAAASGLTMTAATRYVVDPAASRIHVSVALTAVNHLVDTKTHRYYFDRAYLAVQPGTVDFKIGASTGAPTVAAQSRNSTHTLLRIEFGKQLPAGGSRVFNLTFDIPDRGGLPTRDVRIGASLVTFGAWGFGGEGAAGGTVTVIFPAGFTIDVQAAGLGAPTTDATGNTVFASGPLPDPLHFFAYFIADRPNAFNETTIALTVDNQPLQLTLRAWPDDPAWAKRVGGLLSRGLPALATSIGLPLAADRPLIVEEAISRSAAGFAGRYDPSAGKIEIAYYADSFVVLHEAAHAWFDGSLLADRWASEGFASWYALQAAAGIKEKVGGDPLTADLAAARIPLNAWKPSGQNDPLIEDAGYAAALELARLVAMRAGPDALHAVWQDIREGRAAYQPTGIGASPEEGAAAPDWRGLLDLLEEETGKSLDDLWTAWVLRPEEHDLLDQRAAARQAYADVAARARDWRLPIVVRDALRAWQFDQVDELTAGANRALEDRDTVAAAAQAAGLRPPTTMQAAFEGPRGFAAASAEADAELAAIAAYRDAAARRPANPDLLQTIGLWEATPDASLATAATAFEAGDLRATVESTAFAAAVWDSAMTIGRNRVVAAVGSIAAVALAIWMTIHRLRGGRRGRRRRRRDMAVRQSYGRG